ncbi:MAG TPA: GNAT family N-acetyltransferase [Burkholderiaceae bacterium]|jgi:hypothetical protein|nr:GNAT family N-acetyltransferase [Burkholderiaceae bacterium]
MEPDTSVKVEHNAAQSRFEAHVNGLLCVADYALRRNVMVMTHTGVPYALRGHGVAAALVQSALDHARTQGWRVDPQCSYVAAYMRRHPQTHDLLAR